jgi:hypothetical protein
MKRRIALGAVIALLTCSSAGAATKPIVVKELTKVATTSSAEGLVISGSSLITYSNQSAATADIAVNALSTTGASLWQKVIDSGGEDIATAISTGPDGAIWIAGTTSTPVQSDTSTIPAGIENPDAVIVEAKPANRGVLNRIALWKLSATGELLATYSVEVAATPLINSIAVNTSGVSLVGEISDKPFFISFSSSGTFSKVLAIGNSKTSLTSVVRQSDGSSSVFGASSETLGGKKIVGVRDGVLIKITKSGALSTVVRSSAPKATRTWLSADSSLLLSGTVQTGKVIETALTKFAPTFNPIWTTRVPSLGQSLAISGGTSAFLAISSKAPVTGISGWKPAEAALLLLGYSDKGLLNGAWALSQLTTPISMAYSKQYGLYGLALASDQSVSIFHLTSR